MTKKADRADVLKGIVIEESLKDRAVLGSLFITSTKIEAVTERHHTPWLSQWTLHTVEIPPDRAAEIAERISHALDGRDNWYADFKNDSVHYVIFSGKVFCVERSNIDQYGDVVEYGRRQGIPDHQLDFAEEVKEWFRSRKS